MSAVDQAFIRAYTPQASTAEPPEQGNSGWQPQIVSPDEPVAPPEGPAPQSEASPERRPASFQDTPPAAGTSLQPVYQVDALAWPADCTKLGLQASDAVERVCDGLTGPARSPARVAAVAGCRQGDGCTTLLVCAARRLAQGDRRVIVVDADFANPQVARRLGVLPESGWEDVLAGQLPLAEAIIESVEDGLALLPVKSAVREAGRVVESRVATCLKLLRDHYDLVLVDLGDLDQGSPAEAMGELIDRAVVVRDVRFSSQSDLGRVRERLAAAGIGEVGVVENFT
jgi:Mrp family chromosome partitioning ATPase